MFITQIKDPIIPAARERVKKRAIVLILNHSWWYNPLDKWLRGKGMSQFSTQEYFGKYKITAWPNDWIRRWFKYIPILRLSILPYFNGADIKLDIVIKKPKRGTAPKQLEYKLYLEGSGKMPEKFQDEGIADFGADKERKITPYLGHFSFTGEYKLQMELKDNGKTERKTIADFEITSRANMQMTVIWLVLGGIVGFLLGKL